jgi:hypothetical protein
VLGLLAAAITNRSSTRALQLALEDST